MKLNLYGKKIEILPVSTGWAVFHLGDEGKKRPARDIVIPKALTEAEIPKYLEDLLHESATPSGTTIDRME